MKPRPYRLVVRFVSRRAVLAILVASSVACGASTSRAEISVQGTRARVLLDVQDAPLSDVLAQLTDVFAFTFQSSARLDRPITGHYSGRLETVISRLLEKNDYVARHSEGQLSIVVYGSQKPSSISDAVAETFPRVIAPAPPPAIARTPVRRMLANPAGVTDGGYAR